MKLTIIGGGNMGSAIAYGILRSHYLASDALTVIEVHPKTQAHLREILSCNVHSEINESIRESTMIMLAVKPQVASTVMRSLTSVLSAEPLIISVMAGVSTEQIQTELKLKKVVRVMSNIPAQIGMAMSAYYAQEVVGSEELVLVQEILNTNGRSIAVQTEEQIDAVTAISGSGPAYVFYFAEQMIASAKNMGFPEEDAIELVQQTIKGAVMLWEHQNISVETLREQVTSPGGTTEAALMDFHQKELGLRLQQGIHRAFERSCELRKV